MSSEQQSSTPPAPDLRSPRKRGRPASSPPGTGELRVQHIMRLMARFAYDSEVTPVELGEEWNLCPQTVRGYASEASRRVRAIVTDDDEVRETALFALMEIIRSCRSKKKPDERTAVEAIRVMTGVIALKKARQQDGGDGAPTFRIELVEPMKPGGGTAVAAQPDEKTAGTPGGATGAA